MLHSLRGRLFAVTALVVLATACSVLFLAGRTASVALRKYANQREALWRERVAGILVNHYRQHDQSWQSVESIVDRIAESGGGRIVLMSSDGRIIVDSEGEALSPPPNADALQDTMPILMSDQVVGRLCFQPAIPPKANSRLFPFLTSPTLLLGSLAAVVAAILLNMAISRRTLGPIDSLTEAARAMAQGDLSRRVEIESNDEVGTLARSFNAMADALARQEEARQQMVSDVAHELRGPLTNIQGYLEAAQDDVVPVDQDLVSTLYEEAMLLSRLVSDLQELALADTGDLSIERMPVDLSALAAEAIGITLPKAASKQITLESAAPANLPQAFADPQRIGQVLRNLLNNAITAIDAGGTITVQVQRDGDMLRTTVKDTGHGISPEALPHVFDRFYRLDRARARATGGSGLGLSIVKKWVETHGGRVWAESMPGVGSSFHFTLPIVAEKPPSGDTP